METLERTMRLEELPDVGKTETLIDEETNRIAFVKIAYDEDAESPTEWDGSPILYSFSNRHESYIDPDEVKDRKRFPEAKSLLLSYYEHSGSLWSLAGEGPRCQWDTVDVAGVLLLPKDYPKGRKKFEYARAWLDQYNAWANGNVFGYMVDIYELRRDQDGDILEEEGYYRNRETISGGSCWGFIVGSEEDRKDLLSEVNAALALR